VSEFKPIDPLKFAAKFWPNVIFSPEQVATIYSIADNDATFVPAGNMLGKDFVAAFIILWYFLSRTPCKILTTSVKDSHLDVLWGELDKFVRICDTPLSASEGGPLLINMGSMRKIVNGRLHKDSYVKRAVANEKSVESFQGHHVTPDPGQPLDDVPRNLFVCDEASGVPQMYWDMITPWAKRIYVFGNTWPCNNFFKHACKGQPGTEDRGGDIPRPNGIGYYRKILHIRAADSPNVVRGLEQVAAGIEPDGKMVIPGMITYDEYLKRRTMWPPELQTVSLDANWVEGASVLMYPPEWLNLAEEYAKNAVMQKAKTIGVDTAYGGDNTAWVICAANGILHWIVKKTPDTSVIPNETIALMKKWGVIASNVLFDAGGGGQAHVDTLRSRGHAVRSIAFGGGATAEKTRGLKPLEKRKQEDEVRYIYKNRRAEMYGILMNRLDPALNDEPFGIPYQFAELRRQLEPIPKLYDQEGRLVLPPKNKPVSATGLESNTITMKDLIGCSPDEADATVLAVFGLIYSGRQTVAGAIR
jgi:hypothetical protein